MGDTNLPNRAGDAQRKLDRMQAEIDRLRPLGRAALALVKAEKALAEAPKGERPKMSAAEWRAMWERAKAQGALSRAIKVYAAATDASEGHPRPPTRNEVFDDVDDR